MHDYIIMHIILLAAASGGPGLLITPESVLLYPGGTVAVLSGMHDGAESKFRAPETTSDGVNDLEKVQQQQ